MPDDLHRIALYNRNLRTLYFYRAANEIADDVSMNSYKLYFRCCFEQRLTLVAVLDEECEKPDLVGAVGLMVSSRTDPARLPVNITAYVFCEYVLTLTVGIDRKRILGQRRPY